MTTFFFFEIVADIILRFTGSNQPDLVGEGCYGVYSARLRQSRRLYRTVPDYDPVLVWVFEFLSDGRW